MSFYGRSPCESCLNDNCNTDGTGDDTCTRFDRWTEQKEEFLSNAPDINTYGDVL